MNIYLDMNVFCRPFDDQTQPKIAHESKSIEIIFKLMERWQYKVLWSYMLDFENSSNPSIEVRKHINAVAKVICFENIKWNTDIERVAKEIVEKSNARSKDALHLACAIYGKCEYFITCDNRFIRTIEHNKQALKYVLGSIKLKNPVSFIGKELESDAGE